AIKHTAKISQIINDVRNLFALSQGKLSINIGKACIKKSTASAIEYLNDKIQPKNLKIEFNAPSEECLAEIDPSIYENQIITNILTNAIKFSQEGGEIKLDLVKEETSWVLNITDNGIGIPSDILANLFATDIPTSRPGTNGEKGTGFGMPIVEQLVHKFSGSIQVFSPPKSHYEQGTQVQLKFKVAS
ncbi:MAG: ATP-binding protein, partial [Bdellovibrionota bacterium]|nr:ATP-binding protein [Bdellovibrionota bacterium]